MPRYHVYAKVTGSKYLGEFEADSPEQAMEKADASTAARVSFCHQCSIQCENPEAVADDASEIEDTEAEGEVTLAGSVEDRPAKRRAEDIADGVSGVKHVQNNLRYTSGVVSPKID